MCLECSNCSDCDECTYCTNCEGQPKANIITGSWTIVLRNDDTLKIGCEDHHVDEWLGFDDATISKMASGALGFWREWKPVIETLKGREQ